MRSTRPQDQVGNLAPCTQAATELSSSTPERAAADAATVRREDSALLDWVPAFFWLKDRQNRILRANRAAAEAIGKTPAELAGASTYDLYPDQAEHYYRDDVEVITSGLPKRGIIETVRNASGESRWVRTDKIPYRDMDGQISGVIVFAVDITELKRAEAALERTRDELEERVRERTAELAGLVENLRSEIAERRQVEERLALSMWSTQLGLWDWDVATDRVVFDRRWADLLGYHPDEIEPHLHHWPSRVHPDDLPVVMKVLNDHVRDNLAPHYESEHRVRTRSGEYRWISAHGQVAERAPDGTARRVIGTFRDITARKRAEEQLRRQQSELAHVLRVHTVEGMAAEIAHEINQPLGAIANFANGLAARLRKSPVRDTAMLDVAEQISSQALRAARVLQRVRDFTRKDPPRWVPSDVNRLIRDAAHLIETDARRHQIRLVLSLDDSLPPVNVDVPQVEQVVLNLLRNGVESIVDAGDRRHVLTIESALDANGQVEVTVCDTGRGVPAPILDRIFEPLFTTKRDGLGMGLSISRSIIEAHEGRFAAAVTSDRGATFRFTLPPFRSETGAA
jgi:PAS domain S-box-containing protein